MKMKHLLLAAVAAAPMMLAGQANAADTPSGLDASPTISNIDNCTLLSANVTVRLSSNVHAGYYCKTGTTDLSNNMIFFGTCHATGSVADRTVQCTGVDTPIVGCASATDKKTITGRAAFLGSSNGGVITGLNLNANACDDDTTIVARVTTLAAEVEAQMQAAAAP